MENTTENQLIEERAEMSRRGGRTTNVPLHDKSLAKEIHDKESNEKEKWVVLANHADIGSSDVMEYTDLDLPQDIIDEYKRLGYKIAFVGIKNDMNKCITKGWEGVLKTEIPRWGDFFLPTGETFEGGLDAYCTYVDLIVMRIPIARFQRNRADSDKSLQKDIDFSAIAERNGNYADNNQFGGMTALTSSVRS